MRYGRFSTSDPSEFEFALRPWDLLLDSRGGKGQRFEIEHYQAPELTVAREYYASGVRLVGMPPPDQLILAIPVGCNSESSFDGVPIIGHQLYSTSGAALEARYGEATTMLSFQIDLSKEIAPKLVPLVEKLVSNGRSFEIAQSAKDVSSLVRTVDQYFRLCHFYSDGFANIHPRGQALLRTVVEILSRIVLPEVQHNDSGSKPVQIATVSAALEYLRTPGIQCASVSELCSGAGVSERSLQRAVRRQFDCTVIQLLRKWRLHEARRRLLAAGPKETTVSAVALTLGFSDFGRFAAAYERLFDEYPTATLAGPSKAIAPCLGLPK